MYTPLLSHYCHPSVIGKDQLTSSHHRVISDSCARHLVNIRQWRFFSLSLLRIFPLLWSQCFLHASCESTMERKVARETHTWVNAWIWAICVLSASLTR